MLAAPPVRQASEHVWVSICENCDFRDRVDAGGGGEEGLRSHCQEGFQVAFPLQVRRDLGRKASDTELNLQMKGPAD